jgi:thiazole synthase
MEILVNGQKRQLIPQTTIRALLEELEFSPVRVAVEVNRQVVPRAKHAEHLLQQGDEVEVVTLVGGGSGMENVSENRWDKPWKIGPFEFKSRLITGTGKYPSLELMRDCMEESDCEVTTVAVRRERLVDREGRNILDFLDLNKLTILPNTAGCFCADDAIRVAKLGRELLENLGNPGAKWVKLECLGDTKTLLPDPAATLEATKELVKDGFLVLVYTSDDPIQAKRLKDLGAASVMPAGSPIGSGQGVLNPNNIRIILEYLKENDPDYPVIVDAGVGSASDVASAMELGCDGVLLNTAIAHAQDPLRMARAMRLSCEAGRLSYLSGRIPRKLYASASSPMEGRIRLSGTY